MIGIHVEKKLDSFENGMLLSIIGECALAMDNNRNAKEKEMAAVLAKNEQRRANRYVPFPMTCVHRLRQFAGMRRMYLQTMKHWMLI